MKSCPTCKRTYADDGFTFCLDDGALLSAPYDPEADKPVSTMRSSGPPPTVALPSDSKPLNVPLAPTIASPGYAKPNVPTPFEVSAPTKKKSKTLYVAIPIVILVVVALFAGLRFYQRSAAQCPKITAQCFELHDSAYCYLESNAVADFERNSGPAICSLEPVFGLQTAARAIGVHNVVWSTSAGTITRSSDGSTSIDTTGLAGKEITIKAAFTGDGSFCSGTATTTFIVPTAMFDPKSKSPSPSDGIGSGSGPGPSPAAVK